MDGPPQRVSNTPAADARFGLICAWITLTIGAMVALREVDALVSQVPDALGRTLSLNGLTGLGSLTSFGAGWTEHLADWAALAQVVVDDRLPALVVRTYGLLDLFAFIPLYAVLLVVGIRRLRPAGEEVALHPIGLAHGNLGVGAGVVADIIETSILLSVNAVWDRSPVGADQPTGTAAFAAMVIASMVKWGALIAALLGVVLWRVERTYQSRLAPAATQELDPDRPGWWSPLYTHRFSILVIAPMTALGIASGTPILDQIPDIQRAWFTDGTIPMLAAVGPSALVALAIGLALFILGRLRTDERQRRVPVNPVEPVAPADPVAELPSLWPWLLGPAVVGGLGLYFWTQRGDILPWPFGIFVGFGVLVALLSVILRCNGYLPAATRRPVTQPEATRVLGVGDTLAILAFVIPGLGLIRALTAPLVVGAAYGSDSSRPLSLLGVAFGVLAMVVPWAVLPMIDWATTKWSFGTHEWAQWVLVPGRPAHVPDSSLRTLTTGALLAMFMFFGLLMARTTGMPGAENTLALILMVTAVLLCVAALLWLDGAAKPPAPPSPGADGTEPLPRVSKAWLTAGSVVVFWGVPVSLWFVVVHRRSLPGNLILVMDLATLVLVGGLGLVVVVFQRGGSPEVLRLPGLRFAVPPVMTMLLLTAVLVGLTQDTGVHDVRVGEAVSPVPTQTDSARGDALGRQSVSALAATIAADAETAAADHCARAVVGIPGHPDLQVRPVPFLAAEGGGIRAAVWTTLGIDAFSGAVPGGCWQPYLSSGASGGAVGLTLAAVSTPGEAADSAILLAGPQALTSTATGFLLGDTIRSTTGLPINQADGGWTDRAGLMELSWEQKVTKLEEPFVGPAPGAAGTLVLNSTSATTHCRMLLSQADLTPDAAPAPPSDDKSPSRAADGLDCNAPGQVAGSVDLLPHLVAGECTSSVADSGIGGKPASLRASTVSLMASRFPYVTPSAVVTTCAPKPGDPAASVEVHQQLVDGGYADNDGIGTLVDLAPQWLTAIRDHNAQVLAAPPMESAPDPAGKAASGQPHTLLVPVLMYLDNGSGANPAAPSASSTLEFLVPPRTKAAKGQLSDAPAALRRAQAVFGVQAAVGGLPGGNAVVSHLSETTWRSVYVFSQPAVPSVQAPLGWSLSRTTIASLRCGAKAALGQRIAAVDEGPVTIACPPANGADQEALHANDYGDAVDFLALWPS